MTDFAAAVIGGESAALSLFLVEFGYESRTPFNWQLYVKKMIPAAEKLSREEARQTTE